MAAMVAGDVAGTRLVEVPGVSGGDFALLSGAALGVMERFGALVPDPRPAQVITEASVLRGPLLVVMGRRADYGKCPTGIHWAGQ